MIGCVAVVYFAVCFYLVRSLPLKAKHIHTAFHLASFLRELCRVINLGVDQGVVPLMPRVTTEGHIELSVHIV